LPQVPVISIIDDDASLREALKGLVRSLGYSAAAFRSAEEFLSSDRLHDTSCLITDLQMPGLNGVELQKYLIANGHAIPVILVTAFPEERIGQRALSAGAFGFLTKPLDEDILIGCLDRALKTGNVGH